MILPAARAAAADLAFVVNSNDASVSLIDVATRQEVRRIPLLREPHHMALTPDHRSLVIGDTAGNALFFLDPRTGAVQRQVTVSDPYQLVFSPDGRLPDGGWPGAQPDRHLRRAHLRSAAPDPGAQHAEPYQLLAGFGAGVREFAGAPTG